jgi:hypothetical protein
MMMIRCVHVLWGMGTVPFKTGQIKCSVLYEPDWLGDNRTLFTDGAFFRISIGEAKFQSEIAYPGVDARLRDISHWRKRPFRFSPPIPPRGCPARCSLELSLALK